MNTVLSNYGQLCGCPETLKKSCKFFYRGLDIRVSKVMYPDILHSGFRNLAFHFMLNRFLHDWEKSFIVRHTIVTVNKIFNFLFQKLRDFNGSYRLLCFRFCNNVLSASTIIRFGNADLVIFNTYIAFCQS